MSGVLPRVPLNSLDSQPIEVTVLNQTKKKVNPYLKETEKKPVEEKPKNALVQSLYEKSYKKQTTANRLGEVVNRGGHSDSESEKKGQGSAVSKQLDLTPTKELDPNMVAQNNSMTAPGGFSTGQLQIPGVENSNWTSLNSNRHLYYTFFRRIEEKLRLQSYLLAPVYLEKIPIQKISGRKFETEIELIVDAKGYYENVLILKGSGLAQLDQWLAATFRDSTPFLNPPKGMIESDGKIHLQYNILVQFRPMHPM